MGSFANPLTDANFCHGKRNIFYSIPPPPYLLKFSPEPFTPAGEPAYFPGNSNKGVNDALPVS